MSTVGDAFAIAAAIYAKGGSMDDRTDRLSTCLDSIGFSEDIRKADLCSQLEDKLSSDTPFEAAVQIIAAAIHNTNRRYHA